MLTIIDPNVAYCSRPAVTEQSTKHLCTIFEFVSAGGLQEEPMRIIILQILKDAASSIHTGQPAGNND